MSMRLTAALGLGLLSLALALPAVAQDQQPEPERAPAERIQELMPQDVDPEALALARQVIVAAKVSREFDGILPDIADQAKSTFIRNNPQMQLGIIEVVDRIALEMVDFRGQLEEVFARVWASAFSVEELQALLEFFRSPVGEKYAERLPRVLAVQIGMAEQWRDAVAQEMFRRVRDELQKMADAEGMRLQGSAAPQQQGGGAAAQ